MLSKLLRYMQVGCSNASKDTSWKTLTSCMDFTSKIQHTRYWTYAPTMIHHQLNPMLGTTLIWMFRRAHTCLWVDAKTTECKNKKQRPSVVSTSWSSWIFMDRWNNFLTINDIGMTSDLAGCGLPNRKSLKLFCGYVQWSSLSTHLTDLEFGPPQSDTTQGAGDAASNSNGWSTCHEGINLEQRLPKTQHASKCNTIPSWDNSGYAS